VTGGHARRVNEWKSVTIDQWVPDGAYSVRPHRSLSAVAQLRMRTNAEDVTWRFQKHSSVEDARVRGHKERRS